MPSGANVIVPTSARMYMDVLVRPDYRGVNAMLRFDEERIPAHATIERSACEMFEA